MDVTDRDLARGADAGDAAEAARLDAEVLERLRDRERAAAAAARLDPAEIGALLDRTTARLEDAGPDPDLDLRRAAWDALDVVRLPEVLTRIDAGERGAWSDRILRAIDASHFTVGPLFRQRADAYGSKILFQLVPHGGARNVTWRRAAQHVEMIARGLLALDPDGEPGPVAILSDNSLNMALADLACLTSGIVDVMVPANSTETDVAYMLEHCGARTVFVADSAQLAKVRAARDRCPEVRHVVMLGRRGPRDGDALAWESLAVRGERVRESTTRERAEAVRSGDLATIMYTSGTTGVPKAIRFSHRNLVFKRFARALALPEIGERDTMLCYLPLFHTFGRYLEMLGCVFWGATYCFLENPSVEALIAGMRRYRPTVFISVPKKWIQLHEAIVQRADPATATDSELELATRQVTGGELRWGLSAAGHLDSDVFRFFQRQGVELMSGFGMTEATGGITMTPPGEYGDDSLGVPLPGIETRLAEDGELLIRGPYVMLGYLNPPPGEENIGDDGWFATGDIMEEDARGHIRLVDRKKEIYKNIKGETIAPQRIENLFRGLETVGRAFLVGDHREYNTLLLYPNRDSAEVDFSALSPEETHDHFRSIVISVNKFLAPFERIVDFAVIERDLSDEHGELTPKGTPRRKVVERNFADVIDRLYQRASIEVDGVPIVFPNWLFQSLGLTARDLRVEGERISIPQTGAGITVRREDRDTARIGAGLYRRERGPYNLGSMVTAPRLWLGNDELVAIAPLDDAQRTRGGRDAERIRWVGRAEPHALSDGDRELIAADGSRELDLGDLHRAACVMGADDERAALAAVRVVARWVAVEKGDAADAGLSVLARAAAEGTPTVRRRAFESLVPAERDSRFGETLAAFLAGAPDLLDETTRGALADLDLAEPKLEAFVAAARDAAARDDDDALTAARDLIDFLADYGANHPTRFRRLRAVLVRLGLFAARDELRARAQQAAERLLDGYRLWLGPTSKVAVDPETGEEYRWDDVIVFDDDVDEADRGRLRDAIADTACVREAVSLFFNGVLIRLNDVPPGGVWVRLLAVQRGKAVYRVTVQTRLQGSFDVAINVNRSLSAAEVQEEIDWLILAGDAGGSEPLVEDFGGYWPEIDLWSEEFVSGETLARAMRRLARRDDAPERFNQLWKFLGWTALTAYVDFWNRTGRRWEIADPTMSNVIAPTDDYLSGVRIVSVATRRPHVGLVDMLRSFRSEFIEPAEAEYDALTGVVGWDVVFSAVLEVVGEEEGLELLRSTLAGDGGSEATGSLRRAIEAYIEAVTRRGFLPRRLFFAAKRFRTWAGLSGDATLQARASTLFELYETYALGDLAREYPGTRVRFFRETVFRDSPRALRDGLDELIRQLRTGETVGDELIDAVADLRSRLDVAPDDDYFLTRLSFPYLRPEDSADFVSGHLRGAHQSDIVVKLEDLDGNPFRVRHALNPKEVERLYRLFLAAKVDIRFRPEHRYLVALNDRGQLIGGIYYEIEEDGGSAHLEKIVVSDQYRRRGVADGLMQELFNRLRASGAKTVTTGFFRPEYFYAYGFRIERRYAGLVKSLDESNGSS